MWDTVVATLESEFSESIDAERLTRLLVRLLMAAVLGGLLGYERERQGKAAGVRTHMLVAMGAALFVLVPDLENMAIADMSRVVQGIVTGIGFLGAGTIIKHRDEEYVQGMTTAAGIWMTAAIGIACGLGLEATALVSTVLGLAVLALLPKLVRRERP